jgi:putative sterol carrier protein
MREVAEALAAADAEEVARALRGVSDDELRRLLRDRELRRTAVQEAFRRMPDHLAGRGQDTAVLVVDGEAWAVDLATGTAARDGATDGRVRLELDAAGFLRIVTGGADTAAMWLTGDLRLTGDEPFALELAGLFRIPGTDGGDLDPLRIDVPKIAGVVGSVKDRELKERLRGGLRELVLDEIFRRAPEYVRADKAGGSDGLAKFVLTGRADGDADRYGIALRGGAVEAGPDPAGDARVTIRVDGADFLKLVTSNLNPVVSTVRGRIKLKGDVGFAAALLKVFAIPKAG